MFESSEQRGDVFRALAGEFQAAIGIGETGNGLTQRCSGFGFVQSRNAGVMSIGGESNRPCVQGGGMRRARRPVIDSVNVLPCQTVRPPHRVKKDNEVYLNGADGLDWKTLVKCDFVLVFKKSQAIAKRGVVCPQRVAEIRKNLKDLF